MSSIDLGTASSVSWTLGTTGATVVLTVTAPDGSTTTPAVTETSGTYKATVATALAGRYLLKWSKAAAPAATYTDVLNVWPADPRFLVSLVEAKSILGIPSSMTGDEDDLRLVIAATTIVIEDIVGAVLTRTQTQRADGGKTGVSLWERPSSITSVTEDGTVLTADVDYVLNQNAAIIYAGASTSPRYFAPGRQNIQIIYVVGSSQIDANIRLAANELVRHLWAVQQDGHPDFDVTEGGAYALTPSGYLVPHRVKQLCMASDPLAGIG